MEIVTRLRELESTLLRKIRLATDNSSAQVISLSQSLERCRDLQTRLNLIDLELDDLERSVKQGASTTSINVRFPERLPIRTKTLADSRKEARMERERLVKDLQQHDIWVRNKKDKRSSTVFATSKGKMGVPFSQENGNRWFLGLPLMTTL